MGSKIEYVDQSQIYATSYVRNSKAIGVLWAIFTICYAIIGVVSLITPEWIGYLGTESGSQGKIGLWSICYAAEEGTESCKGLLYEFWKMENKPLMAATICVGLAVATALLTICVMLFFCFCQTTTVFHVCAWLQLISAICMIAGCGCFPAGWNGSKIQKICASSQPYFLGRCNIRWAYLLAAIGCLDAVILSILAFILATRHIRLQPDPHYAPASLFKGEMNSGFVNDTGSVAGSRKSLNLHPVLLMHPGQDDTYSQFSQRTVPRSTHSGHYSHPMHHNYQM
ncbi:LHFPL tetraspan subfamily member 3 protein [Onthophagus taurus]|uniref:LHFPL tetraspan subfamily member 3 protein n=1 Tax=Onthophagus taurus TaxID=166361 RepID=UPI000C20A650|nr:LHFPL tetraspan subfamily member 3 protein [Onthophagus taurus]